MFFPVIYYLFVYPISRLPFPALYFFSDVFYVLVYYIIPYRKKVVIQNLTRSFPEKSPEEIKSIAKKFYRHFCDITLESFKMFSITKEELAERCVPSDKSILDRYYQEGKDCICAGGHYNNWEFLAVAGKLFVQQESSCIYKPLANAWFDKVIRKSRSQLGLQMWPVKKTKEMFEAQRKVAAAYFFAMDQSPTKAKRSHWMTFLNQDTGVAFGTEKYAREYNLPVVYFRITKLKRGYYSAAFELVTDEPNKLAHGEIVERLMKMLEADIIHQPEYWLWTHRRWKRKKPSDIALDL